MEKIKIAFFDSKPYDEKFFKEAKESSKYELKFFKGHLTEDTIGITKGFDVVCLFVNDVVSKKAIGELINNGVKLIALRCAGYNNIDLDAAFEHIHVVRVPAYSPYAVAEHAVGLILCLNRKIHRAYYRTQDNNFSISGLLGFDMHGKTVGIIGTGKIGQIVINILNGFGMNIIAYDAFPNKDLEKTLNFEYIELDKLYAKADIISLHCPLLPNTHYIINKDSIAKMKDGVMIINTSRGPLIDTKALIDGLKSKKVGYAGLDVYEEESDYFFEDYSEDVLDDDVLARLLTFNNVLITSHQAFFTKEALTNIADTTYSNIQEFFSDKPLTNEICYQCEKKPCRKSEKGRCF